MFSGCSVEHICFTAESGLAVTRRWVSAGSALSSTCCLLLWNDAVCIDQENMAERNHQVRQMADIYRQARYVLIWAGRLSSALRGAATASARIPHLIGPRPGRVIRNESFQLLTILVKPRWKAALFNFYRHAYLTRT